MEGPSMVANGGKKGRRRRLRKKILKAPTDQKGEKNAQLNTKKYCEATQRHEKKRNGKIKYTESYWDYVNANQVGKELAT